MSQEFHMYLLYLLYTAIPVRYRFAFFEREDEAQMS